MAEKTKYPSETVITFTNDKEAAIYFENVISVCNPTTVDEDARKLGVGKKLAPANLQTNKEFMAKLLRSALLFSIAKDAELNKDYDDEAAHRVLRAKGFVPNDGKKYNFKDFSERVFSTLLIKYNLSRLPILAPSSAIDNAQSDDVGLTLLNAKIIDVASVSWEHILEFRKDDEAKTRLRRLRHFAFENYTGKDQEFVRQDILKRIDDANEAVARWGFETKSNSIAMLLNSKLLMGGTAGSLISVLAGQPLPAAIAAIGTAVIELGKIGIEVRKRTFTLRNMVKDNPVTYFSDAEKRLRG